MSLARDIVDRVFFPNRDVHAIPVLDGGFSPNERLDQVRALGEPFDGPDALVFGKGKILFVSMGRMVIACSGVDFTERRALVGFDANAGCLAFSEPTGLVVCVSGRGVCSVDPEGRVQNWLRTVEGEAIDCPTALAIAGDGSIFIVDGSRNNTCEGWLSDLMQKHPPSGRLIACDRSLANARVLARGLNWPSGVAIAHDQNSVLVSESWPHRLTRFDRSGADPRILVKNFAGYPARIVPGTNQDYWMTFFALRTQLTEFVLREREFRTRMMANVPPHLWVGPTLGDRFDCREPTQIGRIKKLGIQKPWAPPRSYGLVARLDVNGQAIESFHSRSSGRFHGVTSVAVDDDCVLVVSKGHGKIAKLPSAGGANGSD